MGHEGLKKLVDAAQCGQNTAMLSKRRSIGEPLFWPRCDACAAAGSIPQQKSGRNSDPQVWARECDGSPDNWSWLTPDTNTSARRWPGTSNFCLCCGSHWNATECTALDAHTFCQRVRLLKLGCCVKQALAGQLLPVFKAMVLLSCVAHICHCQMRNTPGRLGRAATPLDSLVALHVP